MRMRIHVLDAAPRFARARIVHAQLLDEFALAAHRGSLRPARLSRPGIPSSRHTACRRAAGRAARRRSASSGCRPRRRSARLAASCSSAASACRRGPWRTARPRGPNASRAAAPSASASAARRLDLRRRRSRNWRSQCADDVEIIVLLERIERHPQAEALGQRDLFLDRFARMQVAVVGVRVARRCPTCARASGGAGWRSRRSAHCPTAPRCCRRAPPSAPCSRARLPRTTGRRKR